MTRAWHASQGGWRLCGLHRVPIATTSHSHQVMRSSWVKWCWKWIISSLSPNGTLGTFLPDLVLGGHPSCAAAAGQWLHPSQAVAYPPPTHTHTPTQSGLYRSIPATAFLLKIAWLFCYDYFGCSFTSTQQSRGPVIVMFVPGRRSICVDKRRDTQPVP